MNDCGFAGDYVLDYFLAECSDFPLTSSLCAKLNETNHTLASGSRVPYSHESGTLSTVSSNSLQESEVNFPKHCTVPLKKAEAVCLQIIDIIPTRNYELHSLLVVLNISKQCLEASTGTTELQEQIDVAPASSEKYIIM